MIIIHRKRSWRRLIIVCDYYSHKPMSKKQKPMVRWRLRSGIGGRGPRELQSESNEVEEGRGLRAFVVRSMMR